MLVLSRKVREQICLPGLDVVVTVLEVRGGKVRLGITAPDEIAVFREELWRRLQQDSANAVGSRQHAEESLAVLCGPSHRQVHALASVATKCAQADMKSRTC